MNYVLLDACRIDFVAYMIAEQAHRAPCCRASIKAHRKGKQHGFAHPGVQIRWLDFRAGWASTKPPQASAQAAGDTHEIWAAAQLAPGDGIADGVARVAALIGPPLVPMTEQQFSSAMAKHLEMDEEPIDPTCSDWVEVMGMVRVIEVHHGIKSC